MAHYKDMKGLRLGRLTVVEMVGFTEHKSAIWKCVCDCGRSHNYCQNTLARKKHPVACPQCTKDNMYLNKVKNLMGQTFGDLEVIGIEKDDKGHYKQLCQCSCGNKILVKTNNLLNNMVSSCGCRNPFKNVDACKKYAKARIKDLSGQKFGRWTVLEYSSEHHRWKCLCECGNISYVASTFLKSGRSKSCGCWSAELYRETRLEDLTGCTFGHLTVLQQAEDYICPSGNKMITWLCQCDCGEKVKVSASDLRSGHQLSCGCLRSKGEFLIRDFFIKNNIPYEKQKTFDNLRGTGNGKLSYDFYLPIYNLLIEFQGIQHYQVNERFGGETQFVKQVEHDKRKREFALKNKIDFLEINYNQIKDIEKILVDKIKSLNPEQSGSRMADIN